MRTLRWAADLALKGDETSAAVGLRTLRLLGTSTVLAPEQQVFIDATIAALLQPAEQQYALGQQDVDVSADDTAEEGDAP